MLHNESEVVASNTLQHVFGLHTCKSSQVSLLPFLIITTTPNLFKDIYVRIIKYKQTHFNVKQI